MTTGVDRGPAPDHGAWTALGRDVYDRAWDEFYATFDFTPSVKPEMFPGIREPVPSVTFDVSGTYEDDEAFVRSEVALTETVLQGLRAITEPGEALLALDWQHPCSWFRPHELDRPGKLENWLVPVLPNGDYYLFLTPTMHQGVFGHPWEQTLCIWGADLLGAIDGRPGVGLDHVVRRDGLPTPGPP